MSGQPAYKELEADLEAAILARFDPEQLARAGLESVRRRQVIKEALPRNDVHWDYIPELDTTGQYMR